MTMKFLKMTLLTLALIVGLSLGAPTSGLCANDLTGVPIRIDTPASGDVTISAKSITITNMIITGYTSAKTVTFIDSDGAIVLVLVVPSGGTISWPNLGSREITFDNGFILDGSATELANASDFIFIWKK